MRYSTLIAASLVLLNGLFVSQTPYAVAAAGGVDGGGGQVVYDARAGRVRFVDSLTSEELAELDLLPNPAESLFKKYSPCTKFLSRKLADTKYGDALEKADQLLKNLGQSLGLRHSHGLVNVIYQIRFRVTALHLPQMRDSSRVAPEFQIQAAYYRRGISYLQQQVLADMFPEGVPGLLVKEALRFLKTRKNVRFGDRPIPTSHPDIENSEIEEATLAIVKRDWEAFARSSYFAKLEAPPPVNTYRLWVAERRDEFLQKVLDAKRASQEARPYEEDYNHWKHLHELYTNMDKASWRDGDPSNKGESATIAAEEGRMPWWFNEGMGRSLPYRGPNRAPFAQGFDNVTGKLVWGPCSK